MSKTHYRALPRKAPKMLQVASALGLLALSIVISSPASAQFTYQPRKGYWRKMLVLKDEAGNSRFFTDSRASYPETCARSLIEAASKVEQSNGDVWTDKNFQLLSYAERPGIAEIKHDVMEFKCIRGMASNRREKVISEFSIAG